MSVDFTGTDWTETDPNGKVSVSANLIDANDLEFHDGDTYVYGDYGGGYFDNPTHTVKSTVGSSSDGGYVALWGLSNTVDDIGDLNDSSAQAIMVVALGSSQDLRVYDCETGNYVTQSSAFSYDTAYHYRIDVTSSDVTVSQHDTRADAWNNANANWTLTKSLSNDRTYQYCFGLNNWDIADGTGIYLDVENLQFKAPVSAADLTHRHRIDRPDFGTLGVLDVRHEQSMATAGLTGIGSVAASELQHAQTVEPGALTERIAAPDLQHAQAIDAPDVSHLGSVAVPELEHDHTVPQAHFVFVRFPTSLVETPARTRLEWDSLHRSDDDGWVVAVDGEIEAELQEMGWPIPGGLQPRELLVAGIGGTAPRWQEKLPTPLDEVRLSWSDVLDDPEGYYRIERSADGGSTWDQITTVRSTSHVDGPLEDGTYDYRIVAVDAQGDETTSATATVTVSSAPEPPTGLTA